MERLLHLTNLHGHLSIILGQSLCGAGHRSAGHEQMSSDMYPALLYVERMVYLALLVMNNLHRLRSLVAFYIK